MLGEAAGDGSRRKPFREGEGHTTAAATAGEEEEESPYLYGNVNLRRSFHLYQ